MASYAAALPFFFASLLTTRCHVDPRYHVKDPNRVFSPALVFYKELIEQNIAAMVRLARDPARLRPHVKTHKTPEIVRLELTAGITKHKCATLAEAEMLALCGAPDVLIAYPLVGPNCLRLAELIRKFPKTSFAVLVDHPAGAAMLSEAIAGSGTNVRVMIDLDVGMHRTGIAPGPEAESLYESLARLPGLVPAGISAYDGHNHQENLEDRIQAVQTLLEPVVKLRANLQKRGLPVPAVVASGTPTFPVFASLDIPGLECSPGTCVLHDHGYGSKYRDMTQFVPAALLLTRVISKPASNRLTFDLGYKALASDPPAGKRCMLLDVPEYEPILQSEEHFTVATPEADRFRLGDVVFAVPTHICPTCAVHKEAYVVEKGAITGTWQIVARDRRLTV
ncbi:MAG: D-TA family PLP-dependent enzyme [Planctomycetes bacterium]|nr:D-TA family PLP-dependent enzyme [Planctomycetota bacterium]